MSRSVSRLLEASRLSRAAATVSSTPQKLMLSVRSEPVWGPLSRSKMAAVRGPRNSFHETSRYRSGGRIYWCAGTPRGVSATWHPIINQCTNQPTDTNLAHTHTCARTRGGAKTHARAVPRSRVPPACLAPRGSTARSAGRQVSGPAAALAPPPPPPPGAAASHITPVQVQVPERPVLAADVRHEVREEHVPEPVLARPEPLDAVGHREQRH